MLFLLSITGKGFLLHEKMVVCAVSVFWCPLCFLCVQSKALRERWLLDGAPSAGSEQDGVKKQLEQDETRDLEETIIRSDQHRCENDVIS